MPDDPIPCSAGVLPYVDWQTRHHITYELRPHGASFLLPPPPWWARMDVLAPLMLAGLVFLNPVGWRAVGLRDPLALVSTGLWIVGMAVLALHAYHRRRAVLIELSGDTLRLQHVRPLLHRSAATEETIVIPRQIISDIRFVPWSKALVIRASGREMIEIQPSRHANVLEWVAQELRRAMGWIP